MKATYNNRPEELLYMPLPNGKVDVWLRKNVQEIQASSEDEASTWEADEVYFQTTYSKEYVQEHFEELFSAGGIEDPGTEKPDLSEEISAEEALKIIMGVIA